MKYLKKLTLFILIIVFLAFPFYAMIYLMPRELLTVENTIEIVGLYLSYYTLGTTICISFLMHWLQKRNVEIEDNRRIDQAKSAILLELENAFELYLFMPVDYRDEHCCDGIKEVLSFYSGELRKALSTKEFHLLMEIVNTIHRKDIDGASKYIRSWLSTVYLSEFQQYFVCVLDYRDCLGKQAFELITALSGEDAKYVERNSIIGNDGTALFEKDGDYIRITCDGVIQLDARLGYDEITGDVVIMEGFGRNENYYGQYSKGVFDGTGTQLDCSGNTLRHGIWNMGSFTYGEEYNQLIHVTKGRLVCKNEQMIDLFNTTDLEYDMLGSLDENTVFPFYKLLVKKNGIDSYYIVDMKLTETTKQISNIRTLESFLKQENPELLIQLKES